MVKTKQKSDFEPELRRQLLFDYGPKLVINSINKLDNGKIDIKLNYNKIFHIIDEENKVVYVRNLRFKHIYETEIKKGDNLNLPLDEVNEAIKFEYSNVRNNIIHGVLKDKNLILKLLQNTHLFSAFLNKFYTLVNELVIKDIIKHSHMNQLIEESPKFKKYVDLLVDMNFGRINSKGDLVAENELKMIMKANKGDIRDTVNEAIFKIVKENYDYIVYDLSIFTLKTYVTTVSCLFYLFNYHKIKNIKININDFFKTYNLLYKKVTFIKFVERINNLVYSGVLKRQDDLVFLAV